MANPANTPEPAGEDSTAATRQATSSPATPPAGLHPRGPRVLVASDAPAPASRGGVLLAPHSARPSSTGTVLAVGTPGPPRLRAPGGLSPKVARRLWLDSADVLAALGPGTRIAFRPLSGRPTRWGILIEAEDVLGVLEAGAARQSVKINSDDRYHECKSQ